MTIAAMKAALEALEYIDTFRAGTARLALRAAISEQEKCEPVAYYYKYINVFGKEVWTSTYQWDGKTPIETRPLFTHPAPVPAGEVVITTESGECVAVTQQDEEGRILKVLWEKS